MKKWILISLSVSVMGVLGCSYPLEQVGLFNGDKVKIPDVTDLSDENVEITFDVVQERSLKSCAECHGFTKSADKAIAREAKILARVRATDNSIMPPTSKGYKALNDCQIQILETWFDDQKVGRKSPKIKELSTCAPGKSTENNQPETQPETSPTPAPSATPVATATPEVKPEPTVDFETLEVSFANLKKEILDAKCMKCHAEGKAKETVLETESHITSLGLIAYGEPAEKSILYQVVIEGLNQKFMPPKRSNIPALTPAEAAYLKRYVESVKPGEFDF